MHIPLSWVSLYSPLNQLEKEINIKELAHIYSTHTAEIDGIEITSIDKVVIGKVLSCEKHPESKKLSIVRVGLGTLGEETILTGAENITHAKYVPVALVGATLPGDFTIAERPMAGMMSRGMICSIDEIGLSKEEASGIMILEEIWEETTLEKSIGTSFFELTLPFPGHDGSRFEYTIGEPVFEIDNKFITNRPDLFSVVGNAREFHTIFHTGFTPYKGKSEKITKISSTLSTKIATKNCLSYHLLEMNNISVSKSPFSISYMMERAGLAPKMDLVDITNIIMTELGQPMHVFDKDKLVGDITVRQAKVGEKILALNGSEYQLTEEDMVIADEKGPVAIAGVIGGMESAVSESTVNCVWESGCFDATAVRLTAQRHGIRTDASTRYEKSLDPLLSGTTFPRVLEYLDFLGKTYNLGKISRYTDENRVNHIQINVDYDFINIKSGITIPKSEVHTILENLGFSLSENGNTLTVKVPSWRASKDINIKEDIAEEVSRIYGYEKTPLTPLSSLFTIGKRNLDANLRDIILLHFASHNWNEVYNYSFTNEKLESNIGEKNLENAIGIVNAFNEEYTHMRRSLAPRLLMALAENMKHSKELRFFEIGKVYGKGSYNPSKLLEIIESKPLLEKKMVAGVSLGQDINQLKSSLESLLEKILGYIPLIHTGTTLPFLHPNASGQFVFDDKIIGSFGQVHPATLSAFSLESGLYFELDFSILLELFAEKETRFHPISKYQTIRRELNFVMDQHTPTGEVARLIDALHPWVNGVTVDSVYEDKEKIGEGKKSVNFAFTLSNMEATISDDEALSVQNLLISEMKQHGYELRS